MRKLREVLCDFTRSTEKVVLEIHPSKRKILRNQEARKQKEITVDNIKIEVLPKKNGSAKYLGQKTTFDEQASADIRNRPKTAWAAFHKYGQELISRTYRLMLQNEIVQHGGHTNADICEWNRTLSKEHERLINPAQRKRFVSLFRHREDTKKKDKVDEGPEKDEEQPNASGENCITDEETEEGSKTNSDCEQDSNVPFHEDKDEEIDEKKEMEEEGCVAYIKGSTKEAEDQMNRTRIS